MSALRIVSTNRFSLQELADAYNQTRIDYIVPMPMNVERLQEYIRVYNVDLESSCASLDGDIITGLGMLGVRAGQGWITRLGVLPAGRRRGTGRIIMEHLLAEAQRKGLPEVWLEVIKGNTPAHELFSSLGFKETDELVVARRPPSYEAPPTTSEERAIIHDVRTVGHDRALEFLAQRSGHCAWTNQTASMRNTTGLNGLVIELHDGSRGWITFASTLLQLKRIIVETEAGDPARFAATALRVLHRLYPTQDAIAENFSVHDRRWIGFQEAGYFDSFRRIEMILRY